MPTAAQTTLQGSAMRTRARLAALEGKLSELRAAFARKDIDLARMRDEEAQLLAGRDNLRITLEQDKRALLRESQAQGDAIGASALSARWPLALLPVRLETRYHRDSMGNHSLLVRIYPDEIHVDTHDPGVSDIERTAWERFRNVVEISQDTQPMHDAWLQLARDIGTARALFLAARPNLDGMAARPPGYGRVPQAVLLPERFVAHIWLDDPQASPLRAEAAALVREPLALAPDPARPGAAGDGSLDAASLWMVHFAAAEAAGMALRVPLPSASSQISRLVVLGVRASADPATGADDWQRLLDGQAATGGLSLPPPGSATNALPGQRPLFSTRPDPDAVYAQALAFKIATPTRPGDDPRPRRSPHYFRYVFDPAQGRHVERYDRSAPAVRVAEALGLSPTSFGWLDGAGDDTLQGETAMQGLLRGAFEPGLRAAFGDGDPPMPVWMGLDLLAGGSALGPYPTLMVRAQPYGVLPVALGRDRNFNADSDALWAGAAALRASIFEPATAQVPRIAGTTPADPVDRMIAVLQTEGVAIGADLRLILAESLAAHVFATATSPLRDRLQDRRTAAQDLSVALGGEPTQPPPLTGRVLMAEAGQALPLVAPADAGDMEQPARYLLQLADTASLDFLLNGVLSDFTPRALLFHVARIALLEAAETDTRSVLLAEGLATEADVDAANGRFFQLSARLIAPAPARYVVPGQIASLGDILSDRRTSIGLVRQRFDELRLLASIGTERLELLFGAVLGLYANRLDALYTARAAKRLNLVRSDNLLGPMPDGFVRGVQLGAFGWVGPIPRTRPGRNAGYVLAPSAQHAVAAGVLLSADHARRIDQPSGPRSEDYAVELSSRRTRGAMAALDGLREGQSMPALLGYRIERALMQVGRTAPAVIARLRRIASTAARPMGAGGMALPEAAAEAVCDGLALVRQATAELASPPALVRLGTTLQQPTALDSLQQRTLLAALVEARDAIDAVSDVLLAESVYQLANGNPDRAGGATDILSGAVPPPDRLDVLHPPERGIAVNHRLLLGLDPDRPLRRGWPTGSPRGLADPDLDSWFSQLLPAPERILCRQRAADGSVTDKTFSLQDILDALAGDAPPLGPLDLAYDVSEPGRVERSALEARLRAAATALTGDADAQFEWGRALDWGAEITSMAEATALAGAARALLGNARALLPDDVPGAAAIDSTDLNARLSQTLTAAKTALKALDQAIGSPDVRPVARQWASAFGLPALADSAAADAYRSAQRELDRRVGIANAPGALRERIAALFDVQSVLPRLTGADRGWIKGFAGGLKVPAADLRSFTTRAARVRPALAAMAALETMAQRADDTAGLHRLAVSQTPREPGEAWVGALGTPRRARTSYVAWRLRDGRALQNPADPVCGLIIDRWSELVPAAEADAAIAFHTDAPSTAAPNAILLCVPEAGLEAWSESGVLAHILEALDLARLRTVQPDALGGFAQFAPLSLIDNTRHQASFGHMASEEPAPLSNPT